MYTCKMHISLLMQMQKSKSNTMNAFPYNQLELAFHVILLSFIGYK